MADATDLQLHPDEGDASDEERQREQFRADLGAWDYEARRVELGMSVLRRSRAEWAQDPASTGAIPYRAWLLLNRSFDRANPPREGEPLPGWRLFQLAFILAHLPTLVSRLPGFEGDFRADFDEDAASLLYMSTGGGKTEAFFGAVIFGLFLDRLRGKHRGITAMMHYPLRLLTVQQAQRLARLLAHAEMARRAEQVGGAPFEIGFWVGGGNTPNRTEFRGVPTDDVSVVPAWNDPRAADEEALLDGSAPGQRGYAAAHGAWNKLPTCPFCRCDIQTALRLFPEEHNRLGIVCRNQRCDWNRANHGGGRPTPLPFLLADSDIYRRAPSVLLGTIDKLALIGQNTYTIDAIAGMFGMARAARAGDGLLAHPTGQDLATVGMGDLERVAPVFDGGVELFHDPFPSLIVQDEMHLLEESLGTFGGIFETGLFAWLRRLAPLLGARSPHVPGAPDRPRLPHVIGATATVSDAAKHARALYQLRVRQFPHPGPALHATFYSGMAGFLASGPAPERAALLSQPNTLPRDREMAAPWGRVHASIMTNGRLHTVTTISVLAAHAATITRWERDLASSDAARRERAANEIEQCVSDAPHAAGRRAAAARAGATGRFDRLAALVDLHRIELTYVTNKKGGDQILAALAPEAFEAHAALGDIYRVTQFKTELISGGVDIAGIQHVIREAEAPFDPMVDDISNALRVIVATSAISHGVDVEAFNAMAFAGMPSDIAEYIQASSRVGRTHVGFSLLIPTPQTRRDRFVVEVHESFHRLLERMIAPPAIERWADRAIARTVPSLVQTWLAGVQFQRRMVEAADAAKPGVPLPATVEQLSRILSNAAELADCASFVREAVGIEGNEGRPANPDYYGDLILQELRRIEVVASSGQFTGRLGDFWGHRLSGLQRPMMSLRDVDAAGVIRAARADIQNQYIGDETVDAAMAFIRNRGTGRTAASELDQEG